MEMYVEFTDKIAKLPEYAHADDSGMDLCSIEDRILEVGQFCLVRTGLKIQLPPNTEAQIRPRSGLALKHGITVLNSPGTIDEGYRGELGVILINHGQDPFEVKIGMKIAQLVIQPVIKVKVTKSTCLSNTERNEGGFGSTGM